MPIEVSVTDENVQVSTSGQTVNATVSGGVGPAGPQGPTGPAGPAGAAGASSWSEITGKPSTFAPSAHTHTQADIASTLGNTDLEGDLAEVLATASNASNLVSGTVPTARLGSGTASALTYLRGDQTWATVAASYTLPEATTSTLGGVIVSTGLGVASGTLTVTYGTTAGTACQGNDSRLSDARTPTAHAHGNITSDGKVGATASQVLVTGAAGAVTSTPKLTQSQVASTLGGNVLSDDISYLFNNVPAHEHATNEIFTGASSSALSVIDTFVEAYAASGASSALGVLGGVASSDSRLTDARTPTSHTHGNITNAGAIGSTTNRIVVTGASGVLTTATIGSGLSLSGGTLTASGGGGGSSVGSDLYLWSVYR